MKVFIAIPCGEQLDVRFVDSLIHLRPVGDFAIQMHSGSLVYDARNTLAKEAVKSGADYTLWLDSDMSFDDDLLVRLFRSLGDKDMISGLYFTRRVPFRPTVYSKCSIEHTAESDYHIAFEYAQPIPDDVFEIEACGFGAVLMKTECLRDILEQNGLPFTPMLGLGEDLAFCVRARSCGRRLYCDPKIIVGHTAQIVIGSEEMRKDWNNQH